MFVSDLKSFVATKLGSTAFIAGPGRYSKVEERYRNSNSDKFASRNSATLKSYDRTTKQFNEY